MGEGLNSFCLSRKEIAHTLCLIAYFALVPARSLQRQTARRVRCSSVRKKKRLNVQNGKPKSTATIRYAVWDLEKD